MHRHRLQISLVLAVSVSASACGSRSPGAPGPAVPATAPASQTVNPAPIGHVFDTALRSISGVSIEIVDGPQAGTVLMSDINGEFQLTGAFVAGNTFRASKAGYVTRVQGFDVSTPGGRPWLFFYLAPDRPSLDISGDYTLTLVVDDACSDFPADMRRRTYAATVRRSGTNASDNSYELAVTGVPVLAGFKGFGIGVAGNDLGFWLHGGHDPTLVEQLGENRYLAYSGWAEATVAASSFATLSVRLEGWVDYCAMPSPMVDWYNCGTSNITGNPIAGASIARAHCESANHRLILTRR